MKNLVKRIQNYIFCKKMGVKEAWEMSKDNATICFYCAKVV